MTKIEDIVRRMKKTELDDVANMPRHKLNLLFFSTWEGNPLLCYDPIDKRETLAVVSLNGNEYRIKDFSTPYKVWAITSTVMVVKAKFDTWKEAKSYFANKSVLE